MSFPSTEIPTSPVSDDDAAQNGIPPNVFNKIVIPIIYSLTFVIGFIGNFLVIYVMKSLRSSLKMSDMLVINLALADLLLICTLPLWVVEYALSTKWIFGNVGCKLASWCSYSSVYAATFFITIMAVDRLLAVVFHAQSKRFRTKTLYRILTAVLWVLALAISLPALVIRKTVQDGPENPYFCRWFISNETESDRTWYLVHAAGMRFFIGFAIPLCAIASSYIAIIVYLKRRKSQKKALQRKQNRVTATITLVIIVFVICWLPNQISGAIYTAQGIGLLEAPMQPDPVQDTIQVATNVLIWSHSCVNPFLYAFMREDVKKKLISIWQCAICRCCKVSVESRNEVTQVREELLLDANKNSLGAESTSPKTMTTRFYGSKRTKSTVVSVWPSSDCSNKKKASFRKVFKANQDEGGEIVADDLVRV